MARMIGSVGGQHCLSFGSRGTTHGSSPAILLRSDVVVEPEHVLRVILPLRGEQPLVVLTKRRARYGFCVPVLCTNEVKVDGAGRIRLHPLPPIPRPGDM